MDAIFVGTGPDAGFGARNFANPPGSPQRNIMIKTSNRAALLELDGSAHNTQNLRKTIVKSKCNHRSIKKQPVCKKQMKTIIAQQQMELMLHPTIQQHMHHTLNNNSNSTPSDKTKKTRHKTAKESEIEACDGKLAATKIEQHANQSITQQKNTNVDIHPTHTQ